MAKDHLTILPGLTTKACGFLHHINMCKYLTHRGRALLCPSHLWVFLFNYSWLITITNLWYCALPIVSFILVAWLYFVQNLLARNAAKVPQLVLLYIRCDYVIYLIYTGHQRFILAKCGLPPLVTTPNIGTYPNRLCSSHTKHQLLLDNKTCIVGYIRCPFTSYHV